MRARNGMETNLEGVGPQPVIPLTERGRSYTTETLARIRGEAAQDCRCDSAQRASMGIGAVGQVDVCSRCEARGHLNEGGDLRSRLD